MITHHELCFGCGLANLFGIQLELEPDGEGAVRGRLFLKQDHQGPPGYAHGGVISAVLDEAMALLVHGEGTLALTARLEVRFLAPVPVGATYEVRARVEERGERLLRLSASMHGEGEERPLANGSADFVSLPPDVANV